MTGLRTQPCVRCRIEKFSVSQALSFSSTLAIAGVQSLKSLRIHLLRIGDFEQEKSDLWWTITNGSGYFFCIPSV
ncbi:hypothetical protein M5K25_018782 [Dendrobium thyrsiflorum]|uniref:Uncharacterized protein n=1 Tax=Dendrobium thyrsiflorum TaxID=117978 RepID=A0ABD0UK28_DENTH